MFRWHLLKSEPDKLTALGPKIKDIAVKLRNHSLEQSAKRANQALSQKFYPNLFSQHGSNLLKVYRGANDAAAFAHQWVAYAKEQV